MEYAEFIGGVHCLGFRLETLFWANFDKAKSKLLVSAEVWHQDYFEYAEFSGSIHFFTFKWETLFLRKLGPKHQNCQFELKFNTKPNSNMQNPMLVFTFSVLSGNYPFMANLVKNIKIVSLSGNFVPRLIANLNMWNSIVVFTFYVSYRKDSSWLNLVQKIKIVSSS